jgi:hypothetical protein
MLELSYPSSVRNLLITVLLGVPVLAVAARQAASPPAACAQPQAQWLTTPVGLVLCGSGTPLTPRADPSVSSRAVVATVEAGSRADRAGLRAGDVVHRVAGEAVDTAAEAARAITSGAATNELLINFWRDGHPNLIRMFRE